MRLQNFGESKIVSIEEKRNSEKEEEECIFKLSKSKVKMLLERYWR